MVIPLLKAMERVAETQITKYVKSGKIVPITNVNFLDPFSLLDLIM